MLVIIWYIFLLRAHRLVIFVYSWGIQCSRLLAWVSIRLWFCIIFERISSLCGFVSKRMTACSQYCLMFVIWYFIYYDMAKKVVGHFIVFRWWAIFMLWPLVCVCILGWPNSLLFGVCIWLYYVGCGVTWCGVCVVMFILSVCFINMCNSLWVVSCVMEWRLYVMSCGFTSCVTAGAVWHVS